VPQGIAALTALNFDDDLDENVAAMTEASSGIRSAEVTRAVRSATIDGVSVADGQVIGLVDGKLVALAHGGTFAIRNAHPGLEVRVVLPGG